MTDKPTGDETYEELAHWFIVEADGADAVGRTVAAKKFRLAAERIRQQGAALKEAGEGLTRIAAQLEVANTEPLKEARGTLARMRMITK